MFTDTLRKGPQRSGHHSVFPSQGHLDIFKPDFLSTPWSQDDPHEDLGPTSLEEKGSSSFSDLWKLLLSVLFSMFSKTPSVDT